APSEEWDEWETLLDARSAQLIVSFIRWAEWRLRPITPLWRWQKIFFPDASTAFVFVIWKLVTGTRKLLDNVEPSFVWQTTSI
ncbi:hypothetical protein ACVXHA_16085, partial [Escherichia coli]